MAETGLAAALADARPFDTEVERSFFPSWEEMDALPRNAAGRVEKEDLRKLRMQNQVGRPPGSRNRRNLKFAQYFIEKFGDPLDVMGEIMSMPLDVLIDQMEAAQGGDAKHKPVRAIDAMRLKMEAADKAAPYVRGKQPISVEVTDRKDLVLVVPGLNVGGGHDAETVRAAIEEHGLAAIDPDSRELVLLPTEKRFEPVADAEEGNA
jgi:hypothetical protein